VKILQSPKGGEVLDATLTMYPSRLEVVEGRREITGSSATTYGYVVDGSASVRTPQLQIRGEAGMFFAVPGDFSVEGGGRVVLIQRFGYRGLFVAGRIEETGRLSYIDGCSSTILVPSARVGDPVLNYLRIPGGIDQSRHTHPSIRLGVIARGSGKASGRNTLDGKNWEESLEPGTVFLLDAQELHSFSTVSSVEGLHVITFHPDSDWGPTDDAHPMITRTHLRTK